jgi:hypothetical protein
VTKEYTREEVKAGLQSSIATVVFEKADGSLRTMRCTLQTSYLPEWPESLDARTINEEVLPVWDLDNGGWRSFRLDSIKSIKYGVR